MGVVEEDGVKDIEQTIRMQPSPRFYILLASCSRKMEDIEQGLATYEKAHEKYPNDTDVLNFLIPLCRSLGKTEEITQYEAKLAAIAESKPAGVAPAAGGRAPAGAGGAPGAPGGAPSRGVPRGRARGRARDRGGAPDGVPGRGAPPPGGMGMGGAMAADGGLEMSGSGGMGGFSPTRAAPPPTFGSSLYVTSIAFHDPLFTSIPPHLTFFCLVVSNF
jgi:hypothetical protein